MPRKISIDLGTTNTIVSQWDEGKKAPVTLRLGSLNTTPSSQMPSVIPSLVFLEDIDRKRILAGNEVLTGGYNIKDDPRFFACFKRTIACQFEELPRSIGGRKVSCREAGTLFLQRIWKGIMEKTGGVEEAIFTAPIQSFDIYVQWLSKLGEEFKIREMRVIDEPTAAAIGYEVEAAKALVLVFDFGGGTLDISLVRLPDVTRQVGVFVKLGRLLGLAKEKGDQTAQVLGKATEVLGGEDIDRWIKDDVLDKSGVNPSGVTGIERMLKDVARGCEDKTLQ